jgi:hypothetical protein
MHQARNILAILEAAGRDLLIERVPSGWRVASEQTGGVEGYTCDGPDLVDALGQVTQVLALELGLDPNAVEGAAWTHDAEDDVDAPARIALEGPVEFCKAFTVGSDDLEADLAYMLGEAS